jgi:hypothetical protein
VFADQAAVSPLAEWENFYVIVGSSAGALTGLQFVVIALIAEARTEAGMLEIRAFGSPTVVHFCESLVISAILSAPWHGLRGPTSGLIVCGLAGLAYSIRAIKHARAQTGYQPDVEDWAWYSALPVAAYVALTVTAILLPSHVKGSLFAIAGLALGLLLIGIHNAWDTVVYIAVDWKRQRERD